MMLATRKLRGRRFIYVTDIFSKEDGLIQVDSGLCGWSSITCKTNTGTSLNCLDWLKPSKATPLPELGENAFTGG
jgi:hypothetical protein